MRDLIQQERFEIEVLDRLNTGRFLSGLYFGGGTMLRLCHGLDRYSVDLDFWLSDSHRASDLFARLKDFLSRDYALKDAAVKHYTLLFELRSENYPRSLKIEIRTQHEKPETEQTIAYTPHDNRQVLLQTMTLRQMMILKTSALLNRGEIRDAYDMEFLVKRGVLPEAKGAVLRQVLSCIGAFSKADYGVKLGSLLDAEKRAYYRQQNFRILLSAIENLLQ
jgi:predicted nucleotidyltransferase component of viral defense system